MNNLLMAAGDAGGVVEQVKTSLVTFGLEYGREVVGALIILLVGFMLSRWVGRLLGSWLERQNMEPPVRMLLVRTTRIVIIGFTAVSVLEKFGVSITALVTGVGVASLGVGLALQGVLSDLFAGLSIILNRPFRVDEYIELAGTSGQVKVIELFCTILVRPDLSRVVIPNRKIVGEILRNYGSVRQLSLTVGVAYDSDINQVLALVKDILDKNPRVLKDPAPGFGVTALGDSSINISIFPWTKLADFGPAQVEIYVAIIDRFRAANIEIPFPQREVRLLNEAQAA